MDFSQAIAEMKSAFDEIQQPRPDYVLEKFVVGEKDTDPIRYAQCVLELQIKYDCIRQAQLYRRKLEIEIKELETQDTETAQIDADLKRIDVEIQDRAYLGAAREFEALYRIWKGFSHQYTRGELNDAQAEYWQLRLTRQANMDLLASGRVGVGNQDALRQIGRSLVPQFDHVREVEQRYLETGDVKVLIAVPTELKAEKLPCLEGLLIPTGAQAKYYNVWGRSVADAYNDAAMTLLQDGADFMLTVEDDTFPPPDALIKLLAYVRQNPKTIAGGWYPKRNAAREGTPIIVVNGHRTGLPADGETHEVYTLPMGCTLFPAEVFLQTMHPWFATTEHLTQDSFFSQKARDAGWRLVCDTAIRCQHVDRVTREVFV